MRILTSNILFAIYLVYLVVSSFPALTYWVYQDISAFGQTTESSFNSRVTDISDLNYLKAIKDRAGMKDETEKRVPEKVSNENLTITCIISDRINLNTKFILSKAKHFSYLNLYIDNYPEVAVPPPRSA